MICPYCGEETSEKRQFCEHCSGDLSVDVPCQVVDKTCEYHPERSMRVFYQLIYRTLIMSSTGRFICGILLLFGVHYLRAPVKPYDLYPALRAADILYGVALAGSGFFLLYARNLLLVFAKQGPKYLYFTYGVCAACALVYALAVVLMAGFDESCLFMASCNALIAGIDILFSLGCYFYLRKRSHLFVN